MPRVLGFFILPHVVIGAVIGLLTLSGGFQADASAEGRPVKEFRIFVKEKTIQLLEDPLKQVTVWAYGLEGQEATVPGLVLRVQVGDLVRVHFRNTHTLPHTMHFHGEHPFVMDGNGQRNLGQEQVQMPGESYTYEWVANTPGYYLYHCHFDTANHLDHGMYGLFVVEDPEWPKVDRELITFWDEWDIDGDGQYDTHTINSRSAPNYQSLSALRGETVRLVMANLGYELHTPHLHGQKWSETDTGHLRKVLNSNNNGVISLAPAEIKIVEFMPVYEGTWLFHCHVVPHVADDRKYPRGMLTTLYVQSAGSPPERKAEDVQNQSMQGQTQPSQEKMASLSSFVPFDYPIGEKDQGSGLYNTNCKSCHGAFAAGGYGPKLEGNSILQDADRYWQTVLYGRGNMPAWKDRLQNQDIADILAWLQEQTGPSPP